MGMLFRALAPKPVKKARRALHPVNAVTTPIKMPVKNAVNPAGAVKRAAEREAVREMRGTTPRNEPGLGVQAAAMLYMVPWFPVFVLVAWLFPGAILWVLLASIVIGIPVISALTAE